MLTLHPSNLPNVELFVNIFWDTYLTIHNIRNLIYLYIQYLLYLFLDYLNDSEKYSSLCLLNVIVGGSSSDVMQWYIARLRAGSEES